MPPIKVERTTTDASEADPSSTPTTTPKQEGPPRIDDSIKTLHKLLVAEVQTDFFDPGNRPGSKKQQDQWKPTFALIKALEAYTAHQHGKQDQPSKMKPEHLQGPDEAAAPQTVDQSMIATIERIVEQKITKNLSEATLQTSNLLQQKLDTETQALRKELQTLQAQITQQARIITDLNVVSALADEVRELKASFQARAEQAAHERRASQLRAAETRVRQQFSAHLSAIEGNAARIRKLEQHVQTLQRPESMGFVRELRAAMDKLNLRAEAVEKREKAVEEGGKGAVIE